MRPSITDKKELADRLLEKYGENEPIFAAEILDAWSEYSRTRAFQIIKELMSDKILARADVGIYYFPTQTFLGTQSRISPRRVIEKKFLKENDEVCGYYGGLSLINNLHLTTQVPHHLEVVSSKTSAVVREVKICNSTITLRKSRVPINNQNVYTLMLLDAFKEMGLPFDPDEIYAINPFIKRFNITMDDIERYACYFPKWVLKNIREPGVQNIFESQNVKKEQTVMVKKMEEQEKYIDIISKIDGHYKTMRSMRPIRDSAVRKYYDDFSIAACHNSTAIEGNTFTIDETYLLLRDGVTSNNRSIKEHNEILGYGKGYWHVYECLKNGEPINEELIKAIHKRTVFDEEYAGQYRDIDVVIGNMMTDKVDYAPPPFRLVPDAMKQYITVVNEDLRKFANIRNESEIDWGKLFNMLADHHCRFERIHPFQDGNGRTGRLLLTYEIISLGLLPMDIRYAEKSRYYAGLKNYDSKSKYSANPESKTEGMAKLLAECELRSMEWWNKMFAGFAQTDTETDDLVNGNSDYEDDCNDVSDPGAEDDAEM